MSSPTSTPRPANLSPIKSPTSHVYELWKTFEIATTLYEDRLYQDRINCEECEEAELQEQQAEEARLIELQKKEKLAKLAKKKTTKLVPFKFDERPHVRRYSRVSEELDKKRQEKAVEEAAHLQVKFKAKDIPKSTYRPFKTKKVKCQSPTKTLPEFSFVARDRIKKELLEEWCESERERERKTLADMCYFRAQPAPAITSAYREREKENLMYRKIKKYVRMDTMAKSSQLPFSSNHAKPKKRGTSKKRVLSSKSGPMRVEIETSKQTFPSSIVKNSKSSADSMPGEMDHATDL